MSGRTKCKNSGRRYRKGPAAVPRQLGWPPVGPHSPRILSRKELPFHSTPQTRQAGRKQARQHDITSRQGLAATACRTANNNQGGKGRFPQSLSD